MLTKCRKCRGKGGWVKLAGRFEVFVSCVECFGRGKWDTSKRSKAGKKRGDS